MAVTLKFYEDSALTTEITVLNPIYTRQGTGGENNPEDQAVYLGSVAVGTKFRATSNPGVDQITVSIVDADGGGTGQSVTAVTLALSDVGLDTATPGASLDVGTQILSGVANALAIWVRLADETATLGSYTDLSLSVESVDEEPV